MGNAQAPDQGRRISHQQSYKVPHRSLKYGWAESMFSEGSGAEYPLRDPRGGRVQEPSLDPSKRPAMAVWAGLLQRLSGAELGGAPHGMGPVHCTHGLPLSLACAHSIVYCSLHEICFLCSLWVAVDSRALVLFSSCIPCAYRSMCVVLLGRTSSSSPSTWSGFSGSL